MSLLSLGGLSLEHRRYVTRETLISTAFNTAISIPFAFLTAHGAPEVPLWGVQGMAVDFVPTVFMITLVTALIVTFTTRKRIGAGGVAALPAGAGGWVERAPEAVFLRALICAAAALLIAAPLSIGALALFGVVKMATPTFVAFKAVYGAVLSLLVTPPIALAALCARRG